VVVPGVGGGRSPAAPPAASAAARRPARVAGLPRAAPRAMSRTAAVIGAGVGGISAALGLARAGWRVHLLEASTAPGGLASGLAFDGLPFDAGPYILLDRPGLEWAFAALGLELAAEVSLRRIARVYEVAAEDGTRLAFHADLAGTAAGCERR